MEHQHRLARRIAAGLNPQAVPVTNGKEEAGIDGHGASGLARKS
jgi:hypothetical protein